MTQLASRQALLGTETAFETLAKAKELERQGKSIIHLEIGEPDFDTPEHIRDAAKQALDDGFTHYGASAGQMELREAIARHQTKRQGYEVSADSVIVTPGGKPVMFFTIMALIEQGVEAIYPNPGFPIYESMIEYMGGTAVPLQLNEETGYNADIDNLRSLITPRTKLLIVNSPNNPCGSVIPESDLEKIAAMAVENDLIVLSDEIYKDMYYGGQKHVSITKFPGMRERTVILDGFSKSYAMTGWRLGYGVFPDFLVEPITRLMTNSVSCTSVFSQMAAIAALEGPQDSVAAMMEEFTKRRDLVVEGLNSLPGITCLTPRGAFYAFPNIRGTGMSSQEFADKALYEAGVALLAGTAFGEFGDGYIRISFANSQENLREAIERLRKIL
ncbi:MAG: pyridoxal phosphate-dependent aminotransferase [Chloroflexi bacterium]|nr:pyridoxal phosphate-dependent aminotransferase [Chloroflexota bacterium]MCI0775419.1 pyridoxal phosphate-dependent aminotransferase [Chloroflexota bacterium]MCI0805084.1 pyridoxal phosphate-dependent aminotransferase [Chloroflexota bacterium]MCI0807921.1 pyridoxal phosphate-dependent aminotransferase [Chloroflexota bacterium]MCI0833831.1 pyridoxal phosphate-dependent aminotransferase [Chloroflexota bacterium]